MFKFISEECKEAYEFYQKELSNFETVMKDTNNNLITADEDVYNCMSYAFGVFDDWLGLDTFDLSFTSRDDIDYELLNNIFFACCNEIEDNFNVRRLINSIAPIEEDKRIIAFRIGANDFHFARKNSDGTWTHKPGCGYIREIPEEELFSEAWCANSRTYPYISEIAFFAVKIEEQIIIITLLPKQQKCYLIFYKKYVIIYYKNK